MIQDLGCAPSRCRNSSTSKVGWPGASASSARDRAAFTRHRLSAALGWGWAARRTRIAVARPCPAASDSRRLVVRLIAFASPQAVSSKAPTAPQASASSPAASRSFISLTRTSTTPPGSSPSSRSPGPWM